MSETSHDGVAGTGQRLLGGERDDGTARCDRDVTVARICCSTVCATDVATAATDACVRKLTNRVGFLQDYIVLNLNITPFLDNYRSYLVDLNFVTH